MTIEPVATVSWDEIAQLNLPKAPAPPPGHKILPPRARIDTNSLPAGGRIDVQAVQRTEQKGFEVNAILPFNLSYGSLEDNGSVVRPPDTNGAVGISHVMAMLNTEVRIQTKNGAIVETCSLEEFWSPAGGAAPFDPKLVYDQGSDRWLATCDADRRSAASSILFAISATSNPLGNWTFYRIDVDPGGDSWADFPDLGYNNTWIGITNNMFTVSGDDFEHVDVRVINKASALAGGALTVKKFELETNEFSVRVCHTFGSQSALYMIDNWSTSPQDLPIYRMFAVTGNPVNPNLEVVNWSIPATSNPNFDYNPTLIDATQLGTGVKLETNDTRLMNAVYRGGYIYTVHEAGYPLTGTPNRTELRWFAFSPITGSGFGDYMGGGAGSHWLYPTITVNAATDCIIGFTRSDASRYAEACYMVRDGTPLENDFGPVQVFKSGEGPYDHGSPSRWGDYSSCAVDPVDDVSFWTIQEYAESGNRWGTWWVSNADLDTDDDGILDDGDFSDIAGDAPCTGGNTQNCDDNCRVVANALQEDCNNNGIGDICDANYAVVGSTLPAANAIDTTDPVITVNFCEAMSAASLTTASFKVSGAREGPIAGSVIPAGPVAYFVPSAPFPKNELLTVTLTSAIQTADGIPDFEGYTWSFTSDGCSRAVFQPETNYPSSPQPLSALTADFDGDGNSDVVTAGADGITVSLLLNNGAGGFPTVANLPLGSNQGAIKPAAGDVDGDGDLDLGIVCYGSGTFVILTNNGAGVFSLAYAHSVASITGGSDLADFDADGDLDFVVGVGGANDAITILFNNGQGGVASSITLPALNAPGPPSATDVNNDGWLDVVVGSTNGGAFSVFLNNRAGGFTRSDFTSIDPRDLAVGDFTGDGYLDVATHSSPDEAVQVFINNGQGGYTLGSTLHPVAGWAIVPADLDSDGDLDLATATHSPTQLAWAENNGGGTFTLHFSGGGSRSGTDISALDADHDGSIDVVIANRDENSISVVRNSGPPSAPVLTSPPNGQTMSAPATPLLNCEDVASALYYRFMIDDDPSFGSSIQSPLVPASQWTVSTALGNGTYYWRAAAINPCGIGPWSASRTLVVQGSGGGGGCTKHCPTESGLIAQGVDSGIFAVLPNPFRTGVDIHFAVAKAIEPEIRVFDLQGREVYVDRLAEHAPGTWKWSWRGTDSAGSTARSGIYFVQLRLGEELHTRRIVKVNS